MYHLRRVPTAISSIAYYILCLRTGARRILQVFLFPRRLVNIIYTRTIINQPCLFMLLTGLHKIEINYKRPNKTPPIFMRTQL